MPLEPGIRVLIVDDQDTVLEILRSILRKFGFRNIDAAKDGAQALEKLRAAIDPYGLVISDWNMKPMTGLQLLETMRGDKDLATTPFIMVTGENTKDRVIAAMQAGVSSYIMKPFSPDAVKKRLVSVLGEF
ncbi:MAG TPA: response regulator [Magnetospirillaceae bacterium]|jgi:two-component system chemotaxis response regulator CheY